MKKPILIGAIIVVGVLAGIIIMGYFGRYPSFFPDFIKYNKFFPQIITKEVFEIENFSDPEENFSGFLKEVESTVHKLWREDAKLAYMGAHFIPGTNKEIVAYELAFGSREPYCHSLQVFYNTKITIEKGPYLADSLYRRGHFPESVNNRNLVAIEFIESHCLNGISQKPIEEIKVSGRQAFQLALVKKPELIDMYEENLWFSWLRHSIEDVQPFWVIIGGKMKIDAKTGEILD